MARKKKLPEGFREKNNGYEARFTISGRRYSFVDTDLERLKQKVSDAKHDIKHGIYVPESALTVESWFNTWITEYKTNNVKYGTVSGYKRVFKNYIMQSIGKQRLTSVRPEHIQKIYNTLAAAGYSHKTICLTAIVLNGIFKQAYLNRIIKNNPVELTQKPRNMKKRKEISILTRDQQKIFLQYAKESAYSNLYIVALGTGLRVGELRALEWSDIDYRDNTIRVTGTMKYDKDRGYFKDLPKTGTSQRQIKMIPEVRAALKNQRAEQNRQRLQLGELWQPRPGFENYVFTGFYTYHGFGKNLCSNAINHDIKKILNRIRKEYPEYPNITPHTLRHTFATRGLENGIPPKVMQDILGHTSITMTLDIYSHVLPETQENEIMKISGMF